MFIDHTKLVFAWPCEHFFSSRSRFCGIQVTDAEGRVDFTTVFSGFYMVRTNHIHFKVRVGGDTPLYARLRTYFAAHTTHTCRIYFDVALNDELMAMEPYKNHAIHRTTNTEDDIFGSQHDDMATTRVDWIKPGDPKAGLRAEMIVWSPPATPANVVIGGGNPPERLTSSKE